MTNTNSSQDLRAGKRSVYVSSSPIDSVWGQPSISYYSFEVEGSNLRGQQIADVYARSTSLETAAQTDQGWYWTARWQQQEQEAEQDLREGNYKDFSSLEDLFDDLMTPE